MVHFTTAALPLSLCSAQRDSQTTQFTRFNIRTKTIICTPAPLASITRPDVFQLAEASETDGIARVSLRDMCSSKFKKATNHNLVALPIGTKKGAKSRRYIWDGSKIKLVNQDLLDNGFSHAEHLQDQISRLGENIWQSFFPDARDVVPEYWCWLPWRLSQRFCSSMMQNFATQSLLAAVGVGAQKSLAASAAINWMLKDGLGRIARMTVATGFAHTFDSDLKRVRFTTAVVFTTALAAEFFTPFAPRHFLLLASIGNVGKAIGLTASISTQPAFQQALCSGSNLADVSAKTQAQHMVMDTLALAVSAGLTWGVRNSPRVRMFLPLCVYLGAAAGDLLSMRQELRAVVLRILNRERAEMVAERWLETSRVPTPAHISSEEHLLGPPNIAGGKWPLRVLPLERIVDSPDTLHQLLLDYRDRPYLLTYIPISHPLNRPALPWQQKQAYIAASIRDGATPQDLLAMVLEAVHLRSSLETLSALHPPRPQDPATEPINWSRHRSHRVRAYSSTCSADLDPAIPPRCLADAGRDARRRAVADAPRLVEALEEAGWQPRTFLLSTAERCGYRLLDEQ